jgi:hypothetical protein
MEALENLIKQTTGTLKPDGDCHIAYYWLKSTSATGLFTLYNTFVAADEYKGEFIMDIAFQPIDRTAYFDSDRINNVRKAGELLMDLATIYQLYNDNKAQIEIKDLGVNKITQRHSYKITVNF